MNAKEYKLTCTKNEMQSIQVKEPGDAANFARNFFGDDIDIYESFFLVLTDRANKIVGWYKVSQGGLDSTVIDRRIIYKVALDSLCSGVILVHNHPSGNSTPSKADIEETRKVREGLKLFNIDLLDHIVLTSKDYYSFAAEKSIKF